MTNAVKFPQPKQCYFCHPEIGCKLLKKMYNYDVKILGSWGNFTVLPMIGAGIDGYLLIIHKKHYSSVAEIPLKDLKSLRELLDVIKEEITKCYSPPLIFEHGSTCDNVSCLVDHAHLHITPVPRGFNIKKDIETDYHLMPLRRFTDLTFWRRNELGTLQYQIFDGTLDKKTAQKKHKQFSGYLYYEQPSNNMYIHELENLDTFQPQYIRMILLKKLGKKNWEWNKNIDSECQKRTIEKLKDLTFFLKKEA